MIPGPWEGIVLALAVYRLCRAAGWDTFRPLARARAYAAGEYIVNTGSTNTRMGVTGEQVQTVYAYRRPWVGEFLVCPFCLGFWLSILIYVAWRYEPSWTLTASLPLALSAAAGLVAKNLDP